MKTQTAVNHLERFVLLISTCLLAFLALGYPTSAYANDRLAPADIQTQAAEENIQVSGATIYDGNAKYIEITVTVGDKTYTPGNGFSVTFENQDGDPVNADQIIDAGRYTAVLEGDGKAFSGFRVATFMIGRASMKDAIVSGIEDKAYTGDYLTQLPVVKWGNMSLVEGTDYSIVYKKNKKVGTALVNIVGKNNFRDTLTKTFTVNKAANPMKVKAKTAKLSYELTSQKSQSVKRDKVLAITNAKGKVSCTLKSVTKKYKKYIKVSSKGTVTVRKGAPVGTCKLKITVKAAGNTVYLPYAKTVTAKIKVQ